MHKAVFTFHTPHAPIIYDAVLPEEGDEGITRSMVSCKLKDETTLVLEAEATDIAALRAALNMWLRLMNVADEVSDLTCEMRRERHRV
ncbi:MAG: KEOPS complex subunit Pcc1 [Methanomicrobiales archaeon]|nr:KEOPS complex subunit Pcc1 [Methanomicrobiales archaeon]